MVRLRFDDLGHEVCDFSWCVELSAGFARFAGEIADQIFIGVAKHVICDMSTVEDLAAEVVDEVDELVAGKLFRIVEVNATCEDAVELGLIGALNGDHCFVEGHAELVAGLTGYLIPQCPLWNDEVMHLRIFSESLITESIGEFAYLFNIHVADSLEEEQRENIAAKLRVINVPTKDICSLFEKAVQLRLSQSAKRPNGNNAAHAIPSK